MEDNRELDSMLMLGILDKNNLSFLTESPRRWESSFINKVNGSDLTMNVLWYNGAMGDIHDQKIGLHQDVSCGVNSTRSTVCPVDQHGEGMMWLLNVFDEIIENLEFAGGLSCGGGS
jgi:hypothetical protein